MVFDSRYAAQDWMRTRNAEKRLVATLGIPEYLPALDSYPLVDIRTPDDLREAAPAFVVLNADYVRAKIGRAHV